MPKPSANANDRLAETLGSEIVSGRYAEGERLPDEATLLARFEVSRPTLREAFRTLSSKGLIASRKKVGATVRPRSQWSVFDSEIIRWGLGSSGSPGLVEDLWQLRELLEPAAAAFVAETGNVDAIAGIAEAFQRLKAAVASGADASAADAHFRQAILEAAGNPTVSALGNIIAAALASAGKADPSADLPAERARPDPELGLHQHLLDAIRAGDAKAARLRAIELLGRPVSPQADLPASDARRP